MDITPNLALPYILASQAQKHVTHNEAIRALDALVQISVADRDLATPPGSPAEGDRYIVAAGATGAWAGHDGKIAAWQDAAWMLYAPAEGWIAWVADENALLAFDGAAWVTAAAAAALQNVPMLGVNAAADATNRLALAAAASLFNHAGAGHQQKINKATAADTASQLYQSNLSGRAELGLAGDDDFHIKVSPDGSQWFDAVIIDKDTGNIGVGISPAYIFHLVRSSNTSERLLVANFNAGASAQAALQVSSNAGSASFQQVSTAAGGYCQFVGNGAGGFYIDATHASGGVTRFRTAGSLVALLLDANQNVIVGSGALATTAGNGFLYVPGCPGPPTGTPATQAGRVPIVVDTTNHKLYFYSGGAWRDAGP